MSNVDIEKAERTGMRWRILVIIHIGGPWAVSEGVIQLALEDSHLRISQSKLRQELTYLKRKGLLDLIDGDIPTWGATLTATGTDVVEYTATCPEGISRPTKWY